MPETLETKKLLEFTLDGFTILFGDNGWMFNPVTKEYNHIVITNEGIFVNGEIIAEGKLKANTKHKELCPKP